MKLADIFKPSSTVRTTAAIEADLDALANERDGAIEELDKLRTRRASVVVTGPANAVLQHDEAVARASALIETAEARHAVLAAELEQAKGGDEQSRRKALYDQAKLARKKAARLYRTDYVEAAERVAAILREARELDAQIEDANRSLPDGATAIEQAEPTNGRDYIPGRYERGITRTPVDKRTGIIMGSYRPGDPNVEIQDRPHHSAAYISAVPAQEHVRLQDRIRLPGIGRNTPDIF